jgi:serine/threonine protein kinase
MALAQREHRSNRPLTVVDTGREGRLADTQGTGVAGSLIADRYRIEALLGRGGSASVYRARDEFLGRIVALKVIAPTSVDPSAIRRERAEVELLASLNHRALVTLFDAGVGEFDGYERTFLVMELVDGPTLRERIERGPIAPLDVGTMAVDLAEALSIVHAQGVVHRDIKPGNVLLHTSGLPTHEFTAKLADFGIASLIDSTRVTAAGMLVGTAAYLSPEQARGAAPAPASDVYSLGLVLLESFTRTRAFPGALVESVHARLVGDPPIPGWLGHGWTSLLTAMTALHPESRPTAIEVAVAARALEHELAMPGARADAGTTVAATAFAPTSASAHVPETVLLEATAADSTALMPTAVAEQLRRNAELRAAAREDQTSTNGGRPTPSWRRRLVLAALGLVVVITAALLVVPRHSPPKPSVPGLPICRPS